MRPVRIATDYSRVDSCGSEPYLIGWPLDDDPATLTQDFFAAVCAALPGLPVVLVAQHDNGDIATIGDRDRSLLAARLNLRRRLWELVEVDVRGCSTWR